MSDSDSDDRFPLALVLSGVDSVLPLFEADSLVGLLANDNRFFLGVTKSLSVDSLAELRFLFALGTLVTIGTGEISRDFFFFLLPFSASEVTELLVREFLRGVLNGLCFSSLTIESLRIRATLSSSIFISSAVIFDFLDNLLVDSFSAAFFASFLDSFLAFLGFASPEMETVTLPLVVSSVAAFFLVFVVSCVVSFVDDFGVFGSFVFVRSSLECFSVNDFSSVSWTSFS